MGFSSFKLPETPEIGICLNKPLILAPDDKPFYLKGNLIQQSKKTEEKIGLMHLFPYDLELFSPAGSEIEEGVTGFVFFVRCSAFNIPSAEIHVSGTLTHTSSGLKKNLLPFILEKYSPNEFTSLLSFPKKELQTGGYILHLKAEELNTENTSQTKISFLVK